MICTSSANVFERNGHFQQSIRLVQPEGIRDRHFAKGNHTFRAQIIERLDPIQGDTTAVFMKNKETII